MFALTSQRAGGDVVAGWRPIVGTSLASETGCSDNGHAQARRASDTELLVFDEGSSLPVPGSMCRSLAPWTRTRSAGRECRSSMGRGSLRRPPQCAAGCRVGRFALAGTGLRALSRLPPKQKATRARVRSAGRLQSLLASVHSVAPETATCSFNPDDRYRALDESLTGTRSLKSTLFASMRVERDHWDLLRRRRGKPALRS
jgi:hypothetical protein